MLFLNSENQSDSKCLFGFEPNHDNGISELQSEILTYDLSKYLKRSVTLKNILWEFDILPFRDDLINYFSFRFNIRTEHRILCVKAANNYDNWFYVMIAIFLKEYSAQRCFNVKNLCETIYQKSPLICKRIIEFQSNILAEFNSEKVLIGLLVHRSLKTEDKNLISNLKCVVESTYINFELEEISCYNTEVQHQYLKYKAIFVIMDENLAKCFDENIQLENLEKIDQIYRKFGRLMYKEYIEYGKNLKFYTFVVDPLNASYLNGSQNFFRYHWLLKESECSIEDSSNISGSAKNVKKFIFPVDLKMELLEERPKNLYNFLENLKNSLQI